MQYFYSLAALLPLFLTLTSAHSIVTHLHDSNTATTSCVRRATNTNPITDLTSAAMACNNVRSPASSTCSIRAGSTIAFEYRSWPDKPASEVPLKNGVEPVSVTDDSHKGPCAVYAKKVDDAKTAVGEGDGWIKIYHEAVGKDGLFCTDRLRKGNLPLEVKVPMTLGDGDWLFR